MRLFYSGEIPDSIGYFPGLVLDLRNQETAESSTQLMLLKDASMYLHLFGEPLVDSLDQFVLRVSCFSVGEESGRLVRFLKSTNGYKMVCKTEGDNSIKPSWFDQDDWSKRQKKELENLLAEGITEDYELPQWCQSKLIEDSLFFRYEHQERLIRDYQLEGVLSEFNELGTQNVFEEKKDTVWSVHDYQSIWVLERKLNGQCQVVIRRSPEETLTELMEIVLAKCSLNQG